MEKPDIPFSFSVWDQISLVHDHGVAHRDVRAENILVKKDGKITIIDFGHSVVNPTKPIYDRNDLILTFAAYGGPSDRDFMHALRHRAKKS